MQLSSPSGLQNIPRLPWGSHLAHFFGSGSELQYLLVPYFKAGLENNERCLWVTGAGLNAEQARSALRAAVPDLDRRERDQQIEISDGDKWYASGTKLRPDELVTGLLQREQDALQNGYAGLRTNGNCSWVSPEQWPDFQDYEMRVHEAVRDRRMICLCSYCRDQLRDEAHLDVIERHDMALSSAARSALAKRPTEYAPIEARRRVLNPSERERLKVHERQARNFDLAMVASKMGTWRYTFADNICVYDENAQRLYGLTEARFLHDSAGAKAKFHPDDLELMWSRVAKAIDPKGDGRYDVEYRVKQLDGSWRWLSAWGLVEFEGSGPKRKPVAIVGASRDLTEQKQAEELQQLLLNELNHRVKNTLATIQGITELTMRGARDVPSVTEALRRRIRAMAETHDLLTLRAWSGASLADVITRSLDAFALERVKMSGPAIDVSPKHALALSVALHELATNAMKYGAFSSPSGRVSVQWDVHGTSMRLDWEESDGPAVAPPTQKGFGSRLLELVVGDLGGDVAVSYPVAGLQCCITARL